MEKRLRRIANGELDVAPLKWNIYFEYSVAWPILKIHAEAQALDPKKYFL